MHNLLCLFPFAVVTSDVSGYFFSLGPGVRTAHNKGPRCPTVNLKRDQETDLCCFQPLR